MRTVPQSQPMHHVISTCTLEPKPFTSPSHLSYSARKECQILRTGLGRSPLFCCSLVLSVVVSLEATGTNNPQQRKIQMLPPHFQMAGTDGTFPCARERFFGLSSLGSCSFRRDADDAGTVILFKHTLRIINSSQRTLQPGTSGPPWHNLRKWGTSDTSPREQLNGTARRGREKTEKPRMGRNDSGVYVQPFTPLAFVHDRVFRY